MWRGVDMGSRSERAKASEVRGKVSGVGEYKQQEVKIESKESNHEYT